MQSLFLLKKSRTFQGSGHICHSPWEFGCDYEIKRGKLVKNNLKYCGPPVHINVACRILLNLLNLAGWTKKGQHLIAIGCTDMKWI